MQYSAMEQTRSYLLWSRRKIVGSTVVPPLFNTPSTPAAGAGGSAAAYHESWEEQAFAEDSSGLLGGCVWPPRSYSCSFCRREFRSAQALGGHMNVHRRDRASLKQSNSSPVREENLNQHPPQMISTSSAECYNPNPNPNPNPNSGVDQYTLVSPSYSSSFPIPRPFTDPLPVRLLGAPDLKLGMDNRKPKPEVGSTLGKRGRRRIDDVDDDDDVVIGEKRRRFDPMFPFVKPPPVLATEVLKLGSTSPDDIDVEELDLELRLGDPPKVK